MNELQHKILELKRSKNAVILAHFYQPKEIQEVADFIGDSLDLSRKAANTTNPIIVFCGVMFMAETAKILNPDKKVIVPDVGAGCSLADNCSVEELLAYKETYPDHVLVTYVNCSAEVKAISDYVCTSSNAVKIIEQIPSDQEVIFAPDRNLGRYLQKVLKRPMKLWNASCVVHESFSLQKMIDLKLEYPRAVIIAHPESESAVLDLASFIGSTSQLINYVVNNPKNTFIVATEPGILIRMKELCPNTQFIPAPSYEDNSCSCSECAYMRVNTLEKLANCLENEYPEVGLNSEVANKARIPIEKMLALS